MTFIYFMNQLLRYVTFLPLLYLSQNDWFAELYII